MKLTGKIMWYSDRDKNGIIQTEDGKEWYFDISVVKDRAMPKFPEHKQRTVSFEHNVKITDCRCACNVTLV